MDKFPDNFNREDMEKKIKINQEKIIRKTRKLFEDKIMDAINDYRKVVILHFDSKLWKINRFKILEELLFIHGRLQITTMSKQNLEITFASNLPSSEFIDSIIITF